MKKMSNGQLEEAERLVGLALANANAVESIATALNDEYSKFLETK
jgi:hypothetical protein